MRGFIFCIRELPPTEGGVRRGRTVRGFFEHFFSVSSKPKKIARKIKRRFFGRLFLVSKKPKKVARKIPGKWAKMLRFEPGFHGFVDLGLLYRSVKSRFKTESPDSQLSNDTKILQIRAVEPHSRATF